MWPLLPPLIVSNMQKSYHHLSGIEIRDGIASGRFDPCQIMEHCLARCDEVQQKLNPFTDIYHSDAMAAAQIVAERQADGLPMRPMEGIPVAIKEFTPIKGKRTTRGSAALEHHIADRQPVIVQRLLDAGAIIVARTTTPEFAHSSFTRSPLFGHTLNPFDPSRTSGGSSGGSGVAVATGCAPLAEGTDMGGSVRIPAAFCGVLGLKPSHGRIPMDILSSVFDTISHFGPLARTVDDMTLFMSCVEGADDADIMSQIAPIPLDNISHDMNSNISGLRIAASVDLGCFHVDADVAANFAKSLDTLAKAGAIITPVEIAFTAEMVDAWYDYWCVYLAAAAEDLLPEYREAMDPDFLELVDRGLSLSAVAYRRLDEVRTTQWHAFIAAIADHDMLACPTMALHAPPYQDKELDYTSTDADGKLHALDMTCLFNSIGQCPALSVPSGLTASGLPTAIQLIGRRFDDATPMRVARSLEQNQPWIDHLNACDHVLLNMEE